MVAGGAVGEVLVVVMVELGGADEQTDEVLVARVTVVFGEVETGRLSKKRLYIGPIWAMLVCNTERMTVENLGSQTFF